MSEESKRLWDLDYGEFLALRDRLRELNVSARENHHLHRIEFICDACGADLGEAVPQARHPAERCVVVLGETVENLRRSVERLEDEDGELRRRIERLEDR